MPGPDPRTRRTRNPKMGPLGKGDKKSELGEIMTKDGKNILIINPDMFKKGDFKMAKGGRAMYKSGMRVCKLAKRGKGRAYGKNS